ncbi:hypothetical protein VNO77_01829 [Canavalia gladiata]|uniref:Uncharacterized protein n=1 Tax=Canavalia gladiata TaxID=3824 RepID=A0AAN9MS37_CANGL
MFLALVYCWFGPMVGLILLGLFVLLHLRPHPTSPKENVTFWRDSKNTAQTAWWSRIGGSCLLSNSRSEQFNCAQYTA